MKFFNLLISLIIISAPVAQAKTDSKENVSIKQLSGVVLVDTGQGFSSAAAGMKLLPGQRVYVLETGQATIGTQECSLNLKNNTLFILKDGVFCDAGVARVKNMGNKVAAALGDFGPASDPAATTTDAGESQTSSQASNKSINEEVVELEVNVEEPSLMSSIGSTLAIPAAVAGAVVFSVLAGGGGEEGNPGNSQDPGLGLSAQ